MALKVVETREYGVVQKDKNFGSKAFRVKGNTKCFAVGRSIWKRSIHLRFLSVHRLGISFCSTEVFSSKSDLVKSQVANVPRQSFTCSDEGGNIAAPPPHPAQYINMRSCTRFFAITRLFWLIYTFLQYKKQKQHYNKTKHYLTTSQNCKTI